MDDCGAPWDMDQDEETGKWICRCTRCISVRKKERALDRSADDEFFALMSELRE